MTYTRYRAYRQMLASLRVGNFTEPERELLRDAAEGFLLAPSIDSEELVELSLEVIATLEGVVASGRMSQWGAEHLKGLIEVCGPIEVPPLLEPVA